MREARFGLKAATITPEGKDDVGSPNRLLREAIDGKVIIRTGRRIPGVTPVAGVHYPIAVVRMAVGDAYGAEERREQQNGDEIAFRTERISRSICRAVAEYSFRTAARIHGRVYGGPKWTVSPVYEGMLKEEMDEASERHPEVPYSPVLIDATYAGLISGAADAPLVIPALNRDGDCLSDLVMPMFGSIAGAESVLLAFDDELRAQGRDGRGAARHRAGAAGQGHRQSDGDDPGRRRGAALRGHAGLRGLRHGVARDLRVRARGGGHRRPDARPRRPRHHERVHRRGDLARAHEDRHLGIALGARRGREEATRQGGLPPVASGRAVQTPVQRIAFWLGWWVVCFALWVLLVFKTEPAEFVAGALAAAFAATGAELVRSRGYAPFAPELAWSRGLLRLPREVVMDTWRMANAARPAFRARRPHPGVLPDRPFLGRVATTTRARRPGGRSPSGSAA